MIQANDLRTGNWVSYDEANWQINMVDFSEDKVDLYNHDHITGLDIEQIEPIPLTVEILVKSGFKKEKGKSDYEWIYNKTVLKKLTDLSVAKYGDEIHIFLWSGDCLKHITSVHQLQNLYYSLTGGELEVVW